MRVSSNSTSKAFSAYVSEMTRIMSMTGSVRRPTAQAFVHEIGTDFPFQGAAAEEFCLRCGWNGGEPFCAHWLRLIAILAQIKDVSCFSDDGCASYYVTERRSRPNIKWAATPSCSPSTSSSMTSLSRGCKFSRRVIPSRRPGAPPFYTAFYIRAFERRCSALKLLKSEIGSWPPR
jgi:hypothetical protein